MFDFLVELLLGDVNTDSIFRYMLIIYFIKISVLKEFKNV
jgi:hypothetical protein